MRQAFAGPFDPVQFPDKRAAKALVNDRIIVFHGGSDQRVHRSNAEMIFAEARAGLTGPAQEAQHVGSEARHNAGPFLTRLFAGVSNRRVRQAPRLERP
jgi:hypothetical protein